jgi:hypothetical protein
VRSGLGEKGSQSKENFLNKRKKKGKKVQQSVAKKKGL